MSDFINDGKCITHHYACDCREAHFKQLGKENKQLKEAVERYDKMWRAEQKSAVRAWLENEQLKKKIEVLELAKDLTQYTKEQLQENEKLKAELAKHHWIPVSERLPEKGESEQSEWVYITDGKECTKAYYNFRHKYWYCFGMKKDTITHWKPIILPEQSPER